MSERQEGCVLLMKCKLDLEELGSTSGHLNPKVSGLNIECFYSRDKPPYWFTQIEDDFCIKIECGFRLSL